MARRSATEIETHLFRPGPHYLLSAFVRPAPAREHQLVDAASWLGLDEALANASLDASTPGDATSAWLGLLGWCRTRLPSVSEQRELEALLLAVEGTAEQADALDSAGRGPSRDGRVTLDDLWVSMGSELDRLARRHGGQGAPDKATLRGRRWGHLRGRLAETLESLLASERQLLPRKPRPVSTFEDADYERIVRQLTNPGNGGLAVIDGRRGSGKGELALSYAYHEAERYDHVFWMRAGDRIQLEQDFLAMARHLSRRDGGRDELRREAFRVLEESDRWLIVFDAVSDPALLLPYLPWNPRGHKLCTSRLRDPAPVSDDDKASGTDEDPWSRYFSVVVSAQGDGGGDGRPPGLLQPLVPDRAADYLRQVLDYERAVDTALAKVAGRVCSSRLAIVLAGSWLIHTGAPLADFITRWDELERLPVAELDGRELSDDERAGLRAALMLLDELTAGAPRDAKLKGGRGRARAAPHWRTQVDEQTAQLEAGTLELLKRLEPYETTNFPLDILDDVDFVSTRPDFEDRRLTLLVELGLANRSRMPRNEYFEVNPLVLDAVRAQIGARTPADIPDAIIAVSSRTLLHRVQRAAEPEHSRQLIDLLPHAAALARREAPIDKDPPARRPPRPLVAVELHGRAAIGHLSLARVRNADAHIRSIEKVARLYENEMRATLAAADERWNIPEHPEYHFEAPLTRMWKLVQALRRAGYATGSARLYRQLAKLLIGDDDLGVDEKARLLFEGALALHDAGDVDGARTADEAALKLWHGRDERWEAAAIGQLAVLMLDDGDLAEARKLAEAAHRIRERLLGTSDPTTAREELGRSFYQLGRIADHQGRIKEAEHFLDEAVGAWAGLTHINTFAARANRALIRAGLGEQESAERDVLRALHDARGTYPNDHRNKTMVMSDAAQVLRLGGQVAAARDMHVEALATAEHLWSADHRITAGIRRACAASLLDAGRTESAFLQLARVLGAQTDGRSERATVARARTWTVLSRLLVETASTYGRGQTAHRTLLDLGRRGFQLAQQLFVSVVPGGEPRYPETAVCLLGLAEVGIAHGDPAAQSETRAAIALVEGHLSTSTISHVLPRARHVRARALAAPPDSAALAEELAAEVSRLDKLAKKHGDALATPGHLEVALASIAVDRLKRSKSGPIDNLAGQKIYRRARERIDESLASLRKQIPDDPHQLISSAYAELAELAERVVGPRQRARSERERDRFRPVFDIERHQFDVDRLLRDGERET